MTDDELAFIRAATADPDEDTLRLAYADWLDEQGGDVFASQAAFVRLQVRRARLDVFDPDRAALLEQETALVWKHKRDWNGRIHRYLTRVGFAHKVDARRGLIRGWDYHRGMIARVTVEPEALTMHAELVFALGPIQFLQLATWPTADWERAAVQALGQFLPQLKVVSLVGTHTNYPVPNMAILKPLAEAPILDIRSLSFGVRPAELLTLARSGAISPVVLYQGGVFTTRTEVRGGRSYQIRDHRTEPHVIDPYGMWDALRLGVANLADEVLTPHVYQGASR